MINDTNVNAFGRYVALQTKYNKLKCSFSPIMCFVLRGSYSYKLVFKPLLSLYGLYSSGGFLDGSLLDPSLYIKWCLHWVAYPLSKKVGEIPIFIPYHLSVSHFTLTFFKRICDRFSFDSTPFWNLRRHFQISWKWRMVEEERERERTILPPWRSSCCDTLSASVFS